MNTQTLYTQSELALATYASLTTAPVVDQIDALKANNGMSDSQARAFAAKYTVVTQFNDTPAEGGMGTSFSATVFKDTSGNLTLAIRGTLETGDFFPTDADIATLGVAQDQVVAMWNWWQRVSNSNGQPVAQVKAFAGTQTPPAGSVAVFADSAYNYYLVPGASSGATANGLLANSSAAMAGDSDRKLNVTGHSLGGHLAMAFGSLFFGATSEVAAFNAPGFKNNPGNQQLFGRLGGNIPNGAVTTNVIADEAGVGIPPWTAIAGLSSRPGVKLDIAIENQWLSDEPDAPSAKNHSQQILTDSLAMYNLLTTLSTGLTTANYKTLLAAAASGASASYEHILDGLNKVLGVTQTALPTGNGNRDDLYKAIYALQTKLAANGSLQSLVGKTTLTLADTTLATTAKTDFAAFLSLNALSPVVISTTDAPAIAALKAANLTQATSWTADANARFYGDTTKAFDYSDNWYTDRAALLQAITTRNQQD